MVQIHCKKQYKTTIFKLVFLRYRRSLGWLLKAIWAHFGEVLRTRWSPKPLKTKFVIHQVCDRITDLFLMTVCLSSQPPNTRCHCYLQHFCGVQHVSRSLEHIKQNIEKNYTQNYTKIHTKSYQKPMKKQHPKIYQHTSKNRLKMKPKRLRIFPETAPGATQKATRPPRDAPRPPWDSQRLPKRSEPVPFADPSQSASELGRLDNLIFVVDLSPALP